MLTTMAIVTPRAIKPNAIKSQPQCIFSMPRFFLNTAETVSTRDGIGCSYSEVQAGKYYRSRGGAW